MILKYHYNKIKKHSMNYENHKRLDSWTIHLKQTVDAIQVLFQMLFKFKSLIHLSGVSTVTQTFTDQFSNSTVLKFLFTISNSKQKSLIFWSHCYLVRHFFTHHNPSLLDWITAMKEYISWKHCIKARLPSLAQLNAEPPHFLVSWGLCYKSKLF